MPFALEIFTVSFFALSFFNLLSCHGIAKQYPGTRGNENPGRSCEKQGAQSRKVLCRITTGEDVERPRREERALDAQQRLAGRAKDRVVALQESEVPNDRP